MKTVLRFVIWFVVGCQLIEQHLELEKEVQRVFQEMLISGISLPSLCWLKKGTMGCSQQIVQEENVL